MKPLSVVPHTCGEPEAGPELDAQVDERVMGAPHWKAVHANSVAALSGQSWVVQFRTKAVHFRPRPYSTDLDAAWRVVESLRERWVKEWPDETSHQMRPYWQFVDCGEAGWRVDVILGSDDGDAPQFHVAAPTLPHAICIAALKAIEATA